MNKETLRMQMLSGIITESEYKAKLEEFKKDSLNEHYVAGGIVGIGAINQIPPRVKTDYEDAFEHFLGQKYALNEEEDVEESKEVEEAMVNPNTNDRVNYLESALDHVWNMGKGNNSIDFRDLAQSIVNDMFDDLEEGKEVEEPTNY